MSTLEHALLLYDAGYNIMPLQGKRPTGEWAQFQRARALRERVESYFSQFPDSNIGIICGEVSGITVIDIDPKEDFDHEAFARFMKKYPTPIVVKTGSGGWHLYYQFANVKNAVKTRVEGLKIDVRSQGGYVVAPTSTHPDTGNIYRLINPDSPDDELDFETVVNLRENLPQLPRVVEDALSVERRKLPDDWRAIISNTNEGSRNQNAAAILGKLMGVLPPHEWQPIVWPLVFAWNEKLCNPPLPEHELKGIYTSIAKTTLARSQWGDPKAGMKNVSGDGGAEVVP